MPTIHRLDLGGTSCNESPDTVMVDLDGTYSGDAISHAIVGDYNHCPFPSNYFDHAHGCCYLEAEYDLKELARVLRPGGTIIIGSCDCLTSSTKQGAKHRYNNYVRRLSSELAAAGFVIDEIEPVDSCYSYGEYEEYIPFFRAHKKEQ